MPLAVTIIYKAGVYCVFAFIVRMIESNAEGWRRGTSIAEFLATFSWHRFLAIQIWLFVLFLIFVSSSELTALLGVGALRQLLFHHRALDLALGRRARTQVLVQLGHLTASHTPEELADRASPANAKLPRLLRGLTKQPVGLREAGKFHSRQGPSSRADGGPNN
ncbi:MAG TPA: hypothetical protein VKQ27_12265 [Acetobacteraceae bacterium]|nr:hypothetical protein [Acetobacteraceae bacterium]